MNRLAYVASLPYQGNRGEFLDEAVLMGLVLEHGLDLLLLSQRLRLLSSWLPDKNLFIVELQGMKSLLSLRLVVDEKSLFFNVPFSELFVVLFANPLVQQVQLFFVEELEEKDKGGTFRDGDGHTAEEALLR